MKKVLKNYKEYKNYHRISDSDRQHLSELKSFINNNINDIKNSTWFDLAGGFMMFCIQVNNSTYCIGNDKFDEEKKKRLIHLICRVKGEKVYDEKKMVGDVQIKLDDVDLVIERILGKIRVENTNVL